jgi:hypothetical protein
MLPVRPEAELSYDGPAMSAERFRPSTSGGYGFEAIAIRNKDLRRVDTVDPLLVQTSREQLDNGI